MQCDRLFPLYYRYTTSNGNCYVYDALTGQIVWLSEDAYLLLDDYFVLEKQAFHDQCIAGGFTKERVQSIIKSYRRLESLGILNIPQQNEQNLYPYKIFYEGGIFGCDDFLQCNARLLILEITQQCNLRCEYCCYGDSYFSFRNHSRKIMDIEVAKRAIDEFLHRDSQERHAISFYGGEPLLVFDLLQSIIDYSNQLADALGKQRPSFNLTTNGTLLNDSIIHYFVKNDIAVLISLDGTKESHDRCRKYNTIDNDNKGTFDDVTTRMKRFVELYPQYPKRGVNMVLTAPLDIYNKNAFLKNILPAFPNSRASFVKQPDVCYSCEKGTTLTANSPRQDDCLIRKPHLIPNGPVETFVPQYVAWSKEDKQQLEQGIQDFTRCVTTDGLEKARNEYPLFARLMSNFLIPIHFRSVSYSESLHFPIRCLPGFTRLFCDVFGNYYPCERIGTDSDVCLGNVYKGFDSDAVFRLIKQFQKMTDCDHCVADKICTICYSELIKSEDDTGWNRPLLNDRCNTFVDTIKKYLVTYTSILEVAPNTLDVLVDKDLLSLMEKSKFQFLFRQLDEPQ